MREDIKNPNLIVKNGVLLFVRLLLVMAMAFYTTRLTLQVLGDEDYGINNIIGGVISMFAIISMPITGALQRFFNVEFTRQEIPGEVVFTSSLKIIAILAVGMVLLYESIGLYIVNHVLNYPEGRTIAVKVIFQITIITTVCNFFTLSYSSLLIAKEDMGIPALVEILAAVLKLVFLIVIPFVSIDALIAYSIALFLTGLFQLVYYFIYCWRKYQESHIGKISNKSLQKDILQFSGWSTVNAIAGLSLTYLSNIFINIFGGLLYNTAYGLSQQVSTAIESFTTNVLKAADPQITSSTTAKETSYRDQLVLSTIKLCFLGVGFFYVIFVFYGNFLLSLWLKKVPDYVLPFCMVVLLSVLIGSISRPLRTIILAIGDIKRFYLNYLYIAVVVEFLMFVLLKLGLPIIVVMYLLLLGNFLYFINAIVIVDRNTTLKCKKILSDILRCVLSLVCGMVATAFLSHIVKQNFWTFLLVAICSFAIVVISALIFVVNKKEKILLQKTAVKLGVIKEKRLD